MISSFSFLKDSYLELFTISELSKKLPVVDSNSSIIKSRLFSEKLNVLVLEFESFLGNQIDIVEKNILYQGYSRRIIHFE